MGMGYRNVDIFVKRGYFYTVLISPLFSKMVDGGTLHDLDL